MTKDPKMDKQRVIAILLLIFGILLIGFLIVANGSAAFFAIGLAMVITGFVGLFKKLG
jgi:hypothetical protein